MAESLAGLARVAYETTGLSEFRADNDAAERAYRDATGGMSDAAIKLELSQERLRRSLAKGPSASRESARALLSVRQAERELAAQSDRTTRELDQQQRALGRLTRGAAAGSGIFRGFGRTIAFASGTFLAGGGLVYGLRQALEVGSNLNEQTTKTRAVFGSASREVERFAKSALGQANDQALETASSIGALLRPVGVVEKDAARVSITLTKLGTDLSSFYNTDVSSALEAIRSGLVGESEPLRKYGVQLSEARVQARALAESGKDNAKQLTTQDKLYARIGIILKDTTIAHGDYARTVGGAANQEREFQKNLRNTEAVIGGALQPAYRGLLRDVNKWLGSEENQKRLQRDVNEVIKTGTGIVKGFAAAIRRVHEVTGPLVESIGGVEKAVELAFGAALLLKIRRAATSMGLIATSSATASAKGIADAAAFGRAWDVATRPRTLVVNTPGGGVATGAPTTGAPTTTGGRGRFGRRRGVAERINDFGNPPAPRTGPQIPGGNIAGFILSGIALTQSGEQQQAQAAYDPRTDTFHLVLNGRELMEIPEDVARKSDPALYAKVLRYRLSLGGPRPDEGTRGAITNRATPRRPRTTTGGRGTSTTAPTPRTLLDIQTDLARARTTAGTSDDQRFLTEERNLLRSRIAFLEGRKNLTDKSKQELQRLYGELGQAQSQLDGFAEAREQALDDARERRHKQAVAAQKRRTARAKARQEALLRQRLEDARSLSIGAEKQVSSRFPLGEDRLKRIDPEDLKKKDPEADKIDQLRQELGSLFRDFMTWQVDLLRNGSNVMGGNLSSSVMEQLMMSGNLERTRQTRAIEKLAAGTGPRRHLDDAVMGW